MGWGLVAKDTSEVACGTWCGRLGKELCGGTKPFKLVVTQEGDGSTCAAGEAGGMGSEDEGPSLALYVGQGVEDFGSHFRVESRGRFV